MTGLLKANNKGNNKKKQTKYVKIRKQDDLLGDFDKWAHKASEKWEKREIYQKQFQEKQANK